MDVIAGELYTLLQPTFPASYGQGEPPSCLCIESDGRRYEIPWGATVQASNTCDPEGGVANLSASPYPLLRCSVVRSLADQFEHVPA